MNKRAKEIRKIFCYKEFFETKEYFDYVCNYFRQALKEDAGKNGDLTTKALIDAAAGGRAKVIAKEDGVLAGTREVAFFFGGSGNGMKQNLMVVSMAKDGSKIKKGDVVMTLEGKAAELLLAERTILNIVQRMSGIATLTNEFLKNVPEDILVCPTRKTVLGPMDKKAVFCGGGGTHRINLSDSILIKNNHLAFCTGTDNALTRAFGAHKKGRFIEIEVCSVDEAVSAALFLHTGAGGEQKNSPAKQAADFKNKFAVSIPTIIMFDNFNPEIIQMALAKIKGMKFNKNLYFEASGGITINNIGGYCNCGIDVISTGALTHSAKALDFSMKILPL